MIAVAGMDARMWLLSHDPFLKAVMFRTAERRLAIAEDERQDLAGRIVETFAKQIKMK